jgi:glycine/D-amino acid oxidase-like deaminating enzyme
MTPDGLPIMGSLPEEHEVYFCVGFSGPGNSLGLVAAERTVEVMLDGASAGVFDVN